MYVKPARPDLIVRNPAKAYQPLPPEGAEVGDEHGRYWQRRLADGDVVKAKPSEPDEKPKKK